MEFYKSFIYEISKLQYTLNSQLSSYFRELKDETSLSVIFAILGISFIYGVIHALGPGHGKALVASYFLRSNQSYKKAFKMGYLISIIHALSAMSITFIIYFILNSVFSKTFKEISSITVKISAVLIVFVGFYLVYEAYKNRHYCEKVSKNGKKSDFFVALTAGIVPCPGVMTVILFSIALGKLYLGVFSALLMSMGMGLTISVAATVALGTKKSGGAYIKKYEHTFEYASGFLIIFLGFFLFGIF